MKAVRDVFYFCNHCKVLAVSKRTCYNHDQHSITKISKIVPRKNLESDIEIQKHLKYEFIIIQAYSYEDQRLILFPFNETKNCQDSLLMPKEEDIQ